MKAIYIFLLAFLGGVTALSAQEVEQKRVEQRVVNDTIVVDYSDRVIYHAPFWSNFYIKGDFTGRMLLGEEDTHLSFGDRLKAGYMITLGKKFHPDYGLRLNFGGHRLDGWTDTSKPGIFKQDKDWLENKDPMKAFYESKGINTDNGYVHQIKYWELNGDIVFDLYNIFTHNNRLDSRWDFEVYTGIGMLYAKPWHGSQRNIKASLRLGLMGTYNITDRIGVNLSLGSALCDASFDGIIGKGRKFDGILSGEIGLKWRIGRQGFQVQRIVPAEQLALLSNVVTHVSHDELIEPAVPEAVMKMSSEGLLVPSVVFEQNAVKYNEELQQVNLFRVARFMEEYPEVNITIIGNVKGTNNSLARRRADIVRTLLINQYGISPKRLNIDTFDVNAKYNLQGYDNSVNFTFSK